LAALTKGSQKNQFKRQTKVSEIKADLFSCRNNEIANTTEHKRIALRKQTDLSGILFFKFLSNCVFILSSDKSEKGF
jgi:hypothetical protein